MKSQIQAIACWLTVAGVGLVGCQTREAGESASSLSQTLTIQIEDPICKKHKANGAVISARLVNNSPFELLRLDVDIVVARYGQLTPIALAEQTVTFPTGIEPYESMEIQVPLEMDSIKSLVEQSDLEVLIRPTQIHVTDKSGYVQVAPMHGAATIVAREWVPPSGHQQAVPHTASRRE